MGYATKTNKYVTTTCSTSNHVKENQIKKRQEAGSPCISNKRSDACSRSKGKSSSFEALIVGRHLCKGAVSDGDWVSLIRDPEDPCDKNAIRVDNEAGEAIGNIEKDKSAVLSPFLDGNRIRVLAQVYHGSNARVTPVTIFVSGISEDVDMVMNDLLVLKSESDTETEDEDESGSENRLQTMMVEEIKDQVMNEVRKEMKSHMNEIRKIVSQIQHPDISNSQTNHPPQKQLVQSDQQPPPQNFQVTAPDPGSISGSTITDHNQQYLKPGCNTSNPLTEDRNIVGEQQQGNFQVISDESATDHSQV